MNGVAPLFRSWVALLRAHACMQHDLANKRMQGHGLVEPTMHVLASCHVMPACMRANKCISWESDFAAIWVLMHEL